MSIEPKIKRLPTGLLAYEATGQRLKLEVLSSNAGYYIGTSTEDGPCSRESAQYWPTRVKAEEALESGDWAQHELDFYPAMRERSRS